MVGKKVLEHIGKVIAYIIWYGAAILIIIFGFFYMYKWLGVLGTIIAAIIVTGTFIFGFTDLFDRDN